MSTFLTFVLCLLLGAICSHFALKRGRDPYAWFAIGFFFGLLGILVLFLLPVRNQEEKPEEVLVMQEPVHDYINKKWFYINPGTPQQGPIEFTALKDLWKEEKISVSTFVWCEGMDQWRRIEELLSLQKIL